VYIKNMNNTVGVPRTKITVLKACPFATPHARKNPNIPAPPAPALSANGKCTAIVKLPVAPNKTAVTTLLDAPHGVSQESVQGRPF
jgi:hypothetical protein